MVRLLDTFSAYPSRLLKLAPYGWLVAVDVDVAYDMLLMAADDSGSENP